MTLPSLWKTWYNDQKKWLKKQNPNHPLVLFFKNYHHRPWAWPKNIFLPKPPVTPNEPLWVYHCYHGATSIPQGYNIILQTPTCWTFSRQNAESWCLPQSTHQKGYILVLSLEPTNEFFFDTVNTGLSEIILAPCHLKVYKKNTDWVHVSFS